MRDVSPAFAAHLRGGVTTLCRCWRLRRRDGRSFGFTDHDRDLHFAGTVFAARTGWEAAEAASEGGFAVGGGEVAGALSAAGIREDEVSAGLFDDASVENWLVNWAEPSQRLLLDVGSLGEIRRADDAFVAELRGPMHRLDEENGRLFRARCSADLGDDRCRVDLSAPIHRGTATVAATDGVLGLDTAGLAAHPDGAFTGGRVLWTNGANAGLSAEVKLHRRTASGASLDLWQRAARPIAPGDAFAVTAGCDKRLDTCRDRFGNVPNFRGFPHMPGNDFVLRVPRQGEPGFDGGSLFR